MPRYICMLAQPPVGSCGLPEKQTLCRCEKTWFFAGLEDLKPTLPLHLMPGDGLQPHLQKARQP